MVGLLYGLYYLWKNRKKIIPQKPQTPRHVIVNEKLKNLEAISPFNKPAQVEYYYQLGLLFREVIEITQNLKATDLTFKELKQPIEQMSVFSQEEKLEIIQFFGKSDRIKFAEDKSTLDQAQQAKLKIAGLAQRLIDRYLLQLSQEPKT